MGLSKTPAAALRAFVRDASAPDVGPETVSAAVEQGLAGLLLAALGARPGLVAPGSLDRLREAMRRSLVRGVRLLDLAGRAQRLLLGRGLRSLPLKGAALAEPLYGSCGFRPMLDADLLALDAWPVAVETLLEEGYVAAARADHAVVLVCPETGGILELHRSVTSCPGLYPVNANGLWSRSIPAEAPLLRRPSDEDLLVQLSLHASFQHGLVLSLVQWLDFRRLFERRPPRLDAVAAVAAEMGAEAALGTALHAARAVTGLELPGDFARAFPVPAGLRSWLEPRLARPLAFVAPAPPALARLRLGLSEGRRLRLLFATLGLDGSRPGRGPRALGARVLHLGRRAMGMGAVRGAVS